MVQQFRKVRLMPLQLFILKSINLHMGTELFHRNLMFVDKFKLVPLRLKHSVTTHKAWITKV